MKDHKQTLMLQHMEQKLRPFYGLQHLERPENGWIQAVRTALGMSMSQFAKRLGKSKNSARTMEQREMLDSITLLKMREAADALNMQFTYALLPKGKSLNDIVEQQALKIATDIVHRTAQNMLLENQANSPERIEEAVKARAAEIKELFPKYLWD